MSTRSSNRFARVGSDGALEALIAEGIQWPADGDVTTLSDEAVGELHDAYVAEGQEMAADEDNFDAERAGELVERLAALRTEAQTRFAAAEQAAEDAAATGDEPTDEQRAAALATLRESIAAPAPAAADAPVVDDPDASASLIQGQSISPAINATELAAALVAGLKPTIDALAEARTEPQVVRVTSRDLGAFRPANLDPGDGGVGAGPTPRGYLVHTGDVPALPMGYRFDTMESLADAMQKRWRDIGTSNGSNDEKVVIASYKDDSIPAERDLRQIKDPREIRRIVKEVMGPNAVGVDPFTGKEAPISKGGIVATPGALIASGGLAAPVEPYYPQLVIAQAARPFLASMPTFVAERGGIRGVLPQNLADLSAPTATTPGQFADGVENSSTTFTSATAGFGANDAGQPIIALGIPSGTIISSVSNSTTVILSAAATATASSVTFRLPSRNPNNLGPAVGLVTAAQDAAGSPQTVKFTYDVPDGVQYEHDVYSVYTSLQFANLTARTFPEQVEAAIRLANALAARVAEQAAMNYVTGWSALLTGAKTFGTARQLLAQFEHMAAYLRNYTRMDPAAVVRLGIPAWAVNAMRSDYISSFIGGADNWGLSDDELYAWFADRHILPFFYQDGPTDVNQIFSEVGSGAINTNGVNNATPVAIPDYPGTGSSTSFRTSVVSFMWPEGTWLGLTTGELNLGLVRDSILNSQNRFRNFEEFWETPAFVGLPGSSLRAVHTVAADGTYGSAVSVTLGAGNGL